MNILNGIVLIHDSCADRIRGHDGRVFVLLFLMLAACSSERIVFRPVEVDVPVAVSCVRDRIERPDFAMRHVLENDGLFEKVRAALIELEQRKAYETQMEAQVDACR